MSKKENTMSNNAKLTIVNVEETRPVKQIKVANSKGYLDNIVALTENGKAIRISNRLGTNRAMVTLDSVDALIEALQIIKARGTKMSVNALKFDTASTATSSSASRSARRY
mgnify:CR=1 FL=1